MSRDRASEAAEAMHSAAIRVLRMVRAEDTKSGIGPAQLSALSVLVFGGAKTLGELASAEQVKAPTMSRIVQGLVDQGLAERATHAEDRRAIRIAATARGRKMLIAGRDRRVAALARRFEQLTEAEVNAIAKAAQLLSRLP
jgi:DNA-binding MarR family transcriptional regulator